jgi:hypothetical protein
MRLVFALQVDLFAALVSSQQGVMVHAGRKQHSRSMTTISLMFTRPSNVHLE